MRQGLSIYSRLKEILVAWNLLPDFLTVVNKAAVDIHVLAFSWTRVPSPLWKYQGAWLPCGLRRGLALSGNCWTILQSAAASLHFHQQRVRNPVSSHSCQIWWLLVFWALVHKDHSPLLVQNVVHCFIHLTTNCANFGKVSINLGHFKRRLAIYRLIAEYLCFIK